MQLRKKASLFSVIDAVQLLGDVVDWDGLSTRTGWDQKHLREALRSVLRYVHELFKRPQIKNEPVGGGVQALWQLTQEALARFEQILGAGALSSMPEVQELENLYKKRGGSPLLQAHLTLESRGNGDPLAADILRRLDEVRSDEDYELLFLVKSGGQSYFSQELWRHIQLVFYFDELFLRFCEENPFSKLDLLLDRECHEAARYLLEQTAPLIDAYYKEALKFKQVGLVSSLNKALMALMLAANPQNLRQNATKKSSLDYYQDFQAYLREAFVSPAYLKWVQAEGQREESFLNVVVRLALCLCHHFFLCAHSKKEGGSLLSSFIKGGSEGSRVLPSTSSPLASWNHLLDADESLRAYFKRYPNGPLMKMVTLVHKYGFSQGFDPLSEQTFPKQLYAFTLAQRDVSVLHLPSPTKQKEVQTAALIPEFRAWIHSLKQAGHHHLLINLQDRTNWRERARAICLEEAGEERALTVVTLPKRTDFYLQKGPYAEWDDANEFMKLCREQILGEQTGFFFPPQIKKEEVALFLEALLPLIHTLFFGGKPRLTVQNRQEFVDLLYILICLKLVEMLQVDSLSFTSKDGVDLGATMSAQLYALLHTCSKEGKLTEKEEAEFLWMLYSPALLLRGRVVRADALQRMVHASELVQGTLSSRKEREQLLSLFASAPLLS